MLLLYNSYAIVTTKASHQVEKIHHRQPLMLYTEKDLQDWLNTSKKVSDIVKIFEPSLIELKMFAFIQER